MIIHALQTLEESGKFDALVLRIAGVLSRARAARVEEAVHRPAADGTPGPGWRAVGGYFAGGTRLTVWSRTVAP